jgi:hypothetical protein
MRKDEQANDEKYTVKMRSEEIRGLTDMGGVPSSCHCKWDHGSKMERSGSVRTGDERRERRKKNSGAGQIRQ